MSKSRAELVNEALRELGALPAGQSAAPEDYQVIDGVVEPIMQDLAQRNIFTWGDPDQFDDAAFLHLAKYLANEKGRTFGVPFDMQKKREIEADLRALDLTVLSGQPQQVEYF